jgi:hypothetical protein
VPGIMPDPSHFAPEHLPYSNKRATRNSLWRNDLDVPEERGTVPAICRGASGRHEAARTEAK